MKGNWYIWYEILRNGEHFGIGGVARPYKFKWMAKLAVRRLKKNPCPGNLTYNYYIFRTRPRGLTDE